MNSQPQRAATSQQMEEEKKRKRKTKTSTRLCLLLSLLPEDLIINNILLKLPVRCVMRLRCVCKYFWSLTTSPTFVNHHLDHAKTQLINNNHPASILISYLEQQENIHQFPPSWTSSSINSSDNNHVPPVICSWTLKQLILNTTSCQSRRRRRRPRFLVEDIKIPCPRRSPWVHFQFKLWGSCNGLLCVVGACTDDCLPCIWNPCTKEFKKLPQELDMGSSVRDGFDRVQLHGFGYDRTMDDYKVIVWVHWNSLRAGGHSESTINVYTLGTNSWRGVRCKPFRRIAKLQGIGLYFRGALHWVMGVFDHHRSYGKRIVSFDIEAETIREVVPRPPPHACSDNEGDDWVLQELRGCLCLLIRILGNNIIGVWMMKDYGDLVNGCWTNLLTIVADPHSFKFDTWSSIPLRFCENGEILILKNKKGLYMYDPKKKRARSIIKTRDIKRGVVHFYMETYIESLVSLKKNSV